MKRKLFTLLVLTGFLTCGILTSYAQVIDFKPDPNSPPPQALTYQAEARDGNGRIIKNQPIELSLTIYCEDSQYSWQKVFEITTDNFGMFTVVLGDPNGTDGAFNDIPWSDSPVYLFVNMEYRGTEVYDTIQFLSVPYAMHAGTAQYADTSLYADNVFSRDYNDLFNKPQVVTEPNILIGPGAGNNATEDLSIIAIGDQALANNDGIGNTAIGKNALHDNTDGWGNTAVGGSSLVKNTTGSENTANGAYALYYNTTGSHNTAIGNDALYKNITGDHNTAIGDSSLYGNTDGRKNTAIGGSTLSYNTTGRNNIAIGIRALYHNTTMSYNVAVGDSALYNNGKDATYYFHSTGNTAIGSKALYSNTNGYRNAANGSNALYSNTEGFRNTANGYKALFNNTEGHFNTATGNEALYNNVNGNANTAVGSYALHLNTAGSRNIAIGDSALFTTTEGANNIGIGCYALVPNSAGSNQVRIGNIRITYAGIQVPWTITSDEKWKENIRNLPYGLDMLMKLKPVDYVRKNNEKRTREMGIIAQDLEEVLTEMGYEDQGFLIKDDDGLMHLRYNDFTALLIKAIQDQQSIIEKLETRIETLENQ